MWAIDISEIMKSWSVRHSERSILLSSMYDHQRGEYRLAMECVDPHGAKHGAVKVVDNWLLASLADPRRYVYAVLNGMLKELDEEINKKEENMGINCVKVDNDQMLKMAKAAVVCWYNTHNGPESIKLEDVYIVWFCKTLQNWKALAGTHHGDGMYYEITFNGDKECAYADAYKKWQNTTMTADLLREFIKND